MHLIKFFQQVVFMMLAMAALAAGSRFASAVPQTQLDPEKITNIKAAYLLNFLRFTEWPGDDSSTERPMIVVTIVGRSEVAGVFERLVQSEVIHGRRVEVRRVSYPRPGTDGRLSAEELTAFYDGLRESHMTYIDASQPTHMREILGQVRNRSILTVSDASGFCEAGGMFGLALRDNRIQFDANPGEIERAGLKVSSRCLRLARIVQTAPPREDR